MKPLRITFTLNRPLRHPEYPIHLDALLAWAAVREAERAGSPDPLAAQEHLPLASHGAGADAVWCASQLIFAPIEPPHTHLLVKRFELDALASGRGKVFSSGRNVFTPGSGPFKAFMVMHPMVWTRQVVAYAVGDPERIRELLAAVQSIGKLRRLKMGNIVSRDMVEDERAHAAWRYRVMPAPEPGYAALEANTRPPYWDRTARRVAYAPIEIPGDLHAN